MLAFKCFVELVEEFTSYREEEEGATPLRVYVTFSQKFSYSAKIY
jgi:hypothetical protein